MCGPSRRQLLRVGTTALPRHRARSLPCGTRVTRATAHLRCADVNPSIYVCLEAQYGVSAVASIQTLRPAPTAAGGVVQLPQSAFGANFFALANRSDINTLADIAGRRLEGADLTGLGTWLARTRHCARLARLADARGTAVCGVVPRCQALDKRSGARWRRAA
jgi:hypothetical protein